MKKEELENKLDKPKVEKKAKYKVLKSFGGIEKGEIIPFKDKTDIKYMIENKLIKKC